MSPLVLLHGFTQTGASWDGVAATLVGRDIRQPDLPGHGDRAALSADLTQTARLISEAEGRAVYAGYSMGGRVALHVALDAPALVTGLVLVSATAGIDDPAERRARRQRDVALARRVVTMGADAFLQEWLSQPLFAGLPPAARRSRSTDEEGLASSLQLAGTGTQEPVWSRLGEITAPTLVVAGERDPKFVELGHRLSAGIPGANLVVVPDAGHAVHLEVPDAFAGILGDWLEQHQL